VHRFYSLLPGAQYRVSATSEFTGDNEHDPEEVTIAFERAGPGRAADD